MHDNWASPLESPPRDTTGRLLFSNDDAIKMGADTTQLYQVAGFTRANGDQRSNDANDSLLIDLHDSRQIGRLRSPLESKQHERLASFLVTSPPDEAKVCSSYGTTGRLSFFGQRCEQMGTDTVCRYQVARVHQDDG